MHSISCDVSRSLHILRNSVLIVSIMIILYTSLKYRNRGVLKDALRPLAPVQKLQTQVILHLIFVYQPIFTLIEMHFFAPFTVLAWVGAATVMASPLQAREVVDCTLTITKAAGATVQPGSANFFYLCYTVD